jgi:hypothetical protein
MFNHNTALQLLEQQGISDQVEQQILLRILTKRFEQEGYNE